MFCGTMNAAAGLDMVAGPGDCDIMMFMVLQLFRDCCQSFILYILQQCYQYQYYHPQLQPVLSQPAASLPAHLNDSSFCFLFLFIFLVLVVEQDHAHHT